MQDTIITLVGNVATQPEQHRSSAGDPITRFRIASSARRYDRATGRWQDTPPSYYAVSAFRGIGEHAFASLSKGDRVLLSGRLKIREWSTGDKRGTAAEIEVDAIGHDLAFGTTSYTRLVGRSAERSDAPGDGWANETTGDGDGGSASDMSLNTAHWSAVAPGSASPDSAESSSAEHADGEKELVETPF